MTRKQQTKMESELDAMFQAARKQVDPPSDRLMQAILRDAAEALPQSETRRRPAEGLVRRLLDGIGGWQSVTALAVSACFGLWVGYAAPDSAALLGGSYATTTDSADVDYTFYSDIDDLLTEG